MAITLGATWGGYPVTLTGDTDPAFDDAAGGYFAGWGVMASGGNPVRCQVQLGAKADDGTYPVEKGLFIDLYPSEGDTVKVAAFGPDLQPLGVKLI